MKFPPALSLAALLLATVASAREPATAQTPTITPRAVIAHCAATAPPKHIGLAQLELDCPGLDAALAQLRLKVALAEGVLDRIDAHSLSDLLVTTRTAARSGPDPAQLTSVLEGLQGKAAPDSRWQRFRRWLERMLTPHGASNTAPWLAQWLERLTPGQLVSEIILWSMMIIVVVAAIFVVVRELRAAEFRWVNPLRDRRAPDTAAMPAATSESFDWRQFEVSQRPAALFRYVAARLAAAGRLPPPVGYTHRELRQRARLEVPEQRAAWNELARAAERQVYAPQGLTDVDAGKVVADAARIWAADPP